MKKLALSIISLALSALTVSAVTISVADSSGANSVPLLTSEGSLLPNGGALIRIGFFRGFTTTGDNAALIASLGNLSPKATIFSTIQSTFIPLGEGIDSDLGTVPLASAAPRLANRTINGVANQPGRLIGGVANINVNTDPEASVANPITGVPAGTRIFLLAYNSLSAETATEVGIYSATNWLFPSSGSGTLQLNTTNVDTAGEVFHGRIGSLHLAGFVPEPSTSMMALLAGLGLVARRRR